MSIKPLPPVAMEGTASVLRKQLNAALVGTITNQTRPADHEKLIKKCRKTLRGYSDDTVAKIINFKSDHPQDGLLELIATTESPEGYIRDWMLLKQATMAQGISDPEPLIYGLEFHVDIAPQHDPEKRLEHCTAITKVSKFLSDNNRGPGSLTTYFTLTCYGNKEFVTYIDNYYVRTLLTTHPNPHTVADIIIQRDIMDSDQIMEILHDMEQSAPAITDGVL